MNETDQTQTKVKRKRGRPKGSKAKGVGEWQKVFLVALGKLPVIKVACVEAQVSRAEVYRARTRDPKFAIAWDHALQDGIDAVEANLHMRARDKDTIAAIFLLKNLRPEVYGENVNVNVSGSLSIDEVQQARKTLRSKLNQIAESVAPGERIFSDGTTR
mgnify:CR=1 FL=1|jgi:hypothetical protein